MGNARILSYEVLQKSTTDENAAFLIIWFAS